MVEDILYLLVSLFATIIGAVTGIGGGIVLKSLVSTFSDDPVIIVSFYTTVLVFTMCIVSIFKQIKRGFKFQLNVLVGISLGSIIGGYIGEKILNIVVQQFSQQKVQFIQSIILFITLIFLLLYNIFGKRKQKIEFPKFIYSLILGLFLGSISIFLGIGGGPLNVSLLIICFGYSMKEAAIYSIATVFFSQISKILSIIFTGSLLHFDLNLVPFLIIIAIIGGYIGTWLNQKLSNKKLETIYYFVMLALCILTMINIFRFS